MSPRELFDSCRRLAWQIINKFSRKWPRLKDELESAGMFALWRAALAFDPQRGFKFTTYCSVCIVRSLERLITQETQHRYVSLTGSAEDDDNDDLLSYLAIRQPPVGAALEAREELDRLPRQLVEEVGMSLDGWRSAEIDAAAGMTRQGRRRRQARLVDEVRNARHE
jgi:hypothetical protein